MEMLFTSISTSILMIFRRMILRLGLVPCWIVLNADTWKSKLNLGTIGVILTLYYFILFQFPSIYGDGRNLWCLSQRILTQQVDTCILVQIMLALLLYKRYKNFLDIYTYISCWMFSQILEAIFSHRFQKILQRGKNNILSMLSCGALSRDTDSRVQIQNFANQYVFFIK